ncbi:MAG: PA2779 family protein [Proteobacteria bacterium]|nr:PA2779 family protein [Pseudomonadota bacterium]MBK9250805.1 PA2779 family protein [Pseudomonadota bacterium]
MTPSKWRTTLVTVLTAAVFNFGVMSAAQAGIVSTGAIVSAERDADLASIRGQLQRADVQAQMQEMGVDAASVDARLATLSDSELRDMAEQMKNAPAGGDVLVLLGAVFLVLLVLELVGVIDVFKKVPAR